MLPMALCNGLSGQKLTFFRAPDEIHRCKNKSIETKNITLRGMGNGEKWFRHSCVTPWQKKLGFYVLV